MLLFKTCWFVTPGKISRKNIKIAAPAYNNKFVLPDGAYSVSHIKNCIKCIIKLMKHNHATLLFMFISTGSKKDYHSK